MPPHKQQATVRSRRSYDDEFKREAVQMLLVNHTELGHWTTVGRLSNNPA